MRFGVLGPLVAEDARGPVALRGPRHRAVLARLLVARGRVVPVRVLADDLWPDPPENAVGAIQTFVGALRQALEPDRPPRTPATLLVTEAPGYALRAAPDAVDAWRFEAALTEDADLSTVERALALWRGPAYPEFAEEPWARAEALRLEELRLVAVERRAELRLGRPEAVADLRAHVAEHPLRENGWRLLALGLYRAGRQGDALAALRSAKAVLTGELGVDPGPELRQLESDILNQSPNLNAPLTPATSPAELPPTAAPATPRTATLVGRDPELARLAATPPQLRLTLLSGEAGAGKTALAEALTTTLTARGWTTAWGRTPEDHAPATWPWTQLLTALTKSTGLPAPTDPAAGRFHWHRAIVSYVDNVASRAPLLLVLDDLHRAGEDTLSLLATLVTEAPARPIRVLATYRSTEITPPLADLLARVARAEPERIYLDGLPEPALAELARATSQRELPDATARIIHERSGGNPFFARELARLYDTEGESALSAVPAGVRDVIRHRLTALPEPQRTVLHQAAVLGREADLDLLIPLSGNEDLVLDTVDSALLLGFLAESGPDRIRFTHALVRDTLYEDISGPRRARWHTSLARTLERLRPNDIESLAHHYLHSGQRDPAARYAAEAARRAEHRFAPHEAARLWQAALDHHDGDPRTRLDLRMGLVRTLALTGDLDTARAHRAAALTETDAQGDPVRTAQIIGAFDVPANWPANDDPDLSAQLVEVSERALAALPPGHPTDRARLLANLAMELRGTRSTRARAAAAEAESLARELGDPTLLAFALNGRYLQTFHRTGLAPDRATLGRELLGLAEENDLIPYQVLGHLVLLQSHSALAEFTQADTHAKAADDLAARHDIPLVGVFTSLYGALRLAVAGDPQAEPAYRAAAARLARTGMRGMIPGLLPLALLSLRPELSAVDPRQDWGPYQEWVRPLVLLAAGDRDAALAAVRALPETPGDLLAEARLCLLARAAIELEDENSLQRAYGEFLPATAELAGAASGVLSFGPVAGYLAELAAALGRPDEASAHRRRAEVFRAG